MDAKYRTPWASDKMLKRDDRSRDSDTDGSKSGEEVHVTMEGLLQGSFHDRKSAPQKKKKTKKPKRISVIQKSALGLFQNNIWR